MELRCLTPTTTIVDHDFASHKEDASNPWNINPDMSCAGTNMIFRVNCLGQ
ncbi:hypothetical protein F2Q70_00022827 [Brassica cretica]|uniref:Uncharacterized protein n=1 Tax=Brassica cretica TaxID=69181 RepID=A0A8S9H085_BRACR|nr:hypothetical protein F2Q70_00022827 [Brassica cretica]KAF3609554.1 hypothetical protein DY000_02049703 [Brassica cretica]